MSVAAAAAVTVRDLSKVFMIPTERHMSLKRHMLNFFRSSPTRRFEALAGLSFEVQAGEFFGIIGHNGSGKSTLLKILAGIYQPTRGRVDVRGRLSPFIELGVGFNPELTARENVFLNGAILGLSRVQIASQFDEIIGFGELEEFVDQKLKNFSSGMMVRLAFAVAVQAHADILLIDEVLAVGDSEFQRKCFDVFRRFKAEGKTIVFVSHDLASIKEFSDRVLLLDHGNAVGTFSADHAIARYQQLNEERANAALTRAGRGGERTSGQRAHLVRVEMIKDGVGTTHLVHRSDPVRIRLVVANPERLVVNGGVAIHRSDGLLCFATNTFIEELARPESGAAELVLELSFPQMLLQRGTYRLTIGLFGQDPTRVYEMTEAAFELQVTQSDTYEGVMFMPHQWRAT